MRASISSTRRSIGSTRGNPPTHAGGSWRAPPPRWAAWGWYLVGTAAFGFAGLGQQAVVAAEFMGVEAVHRALARQSLGKLGNDRVFIRADNREERGAPRSGPDRRRSELPASRRELGARRRAGADAAATRYSARLSGFSSRSRMWPRNCAASAP